MALRLYMDEDSLDRGVVEGLRRRGIVLTAEEAGRRRRADHEQLAFAAAEERAIYTANVGDFVRLHTEWMRSGRKHSGVLVRPRQLTAVGDQVRALVALNALAERRALDNTIVFL